MLRLLLLALAVLALPFRATAPAAEPSTPVDGGTYRRPLGNEPATLDPARIADVYSRSVAQQIFDGLVAFDHTLAIRPALAEFWKASPDGRTWTFTLREGARFHHGREVTAADVVFSFTRVLDPGVRSSAAAVFSAIRGARAFRAGQAARVEGLRALDRRTVRIELDEALAPFVAALAVGHAKIVPRDEVERLGDEFGKQPVGTGPFRFARWQPGREIVLEANPEHFAGAPRLARLVYRIFPGAPIDAMYEEFRRGGLEDTPIPASNYRAAVATPGAQYVRRPMFSLRHYGFNTRVRPLDDRRIRGAIAHAVDREAIVEEVFLGRYTLARGILPPGTPGFNPQVVGPAHDLERARRLLTEAGHPGGRGLPPIEIWSSVRHAGIEAEHRRIERDLAEVGIRAVFRYLTDWPRFVDGLEAGRFAMYLYAWYADVPDPDNFLRHLFHSRSPRNYSGYADRDVDDLLRLAGTERDARRRVALYRQVEQRVLDDLPLLPVWHYTYERLFQSYVRSVEVNGLGDPYIPLGKVWLDRRP